MSASLRTSSGSFQPGSPGVGWQNGAGRPETLRRRPLRRRERTLVALEGFISVCGLAGGLDLATRPRAAMPMRYLEGTWFHTWRWPGLALFFFVGVCPALVMVLTLRRAPVSTLGHLCVGAGLVAWIVLEAAWVVISPPLQIAVGIIGAATFILAVIEAKHAGAGRGRWPPGPASADIAALRHSGS